MKPSRLPRKPRKISRKPGRIPKSLLEKADTVFSWKIRRRDGECLFPNCKITDLNKLQCSHYIGRATKSTRFDEDNCIALCWKHHYADKLLGFEYQKQTKKEHGRDGEYTIFMRKHLGRTRFALLNRRAKQKLKLTREYLTNLIEELKSL